MKNVTNLVSKGGSESLINIAKAEAHYNARYIGQMCLRTKDGMWANEPAEIFYQDVPPVEGYSHYLALFVRGRQLYVTSGESAASGSITGVVADNGAIIYSRYRHDYHTSSDGSVWIDGGRDYTRTGNIDRLVELKIVDGEWFQVEKETNG